MATEPSPPASGPPASGPPASSPPGPRQYVRDGLEFARALTFFDAVYAFALTLLITTVDDFSPQAWRSPPALWDANGPALTSFTVSFVVVVRFWRASHRQVATFRHLDNRLITLQILVLFGIVLLPFSTEAMGEPDLKDLPLPVAVYAVDVAVTFLLGVTMTVVADRSDVRSRPLTAAERRQSVAAGLTVPAVFLLSVPVAYLTRPVVAQASWVSLVVLVPLVMRLAARGATTRVDSAP